MSRDITIHATSVTATTQSRYRCDVGTCKATFDAEEPRRTDTNQDVGCPTCGGCETTMIGPPVSLVGEAWYTRQAKARS